MLGATVRPILSSSGALVAIRGVVRSDDERRDFDRALRESEDRFPAILDAAQNGIVVVDHEGRTLLANAALCEMLRCTGGRAHGPSAALELELTETTAALGLDPVYEVIRGVRELGVSIAIDDFGIGRSWLGRLRQFPARAEDRSELHQ